MSAVFLKSADQLSTFCRILHQCPFKELEIRKTNYRRFLSLIYPRNPLRRLGRRLVSQDIGPLKCCAHVNCLLLELPVPQPRSCWLGKPGSLELFNLTLAQKLSPPNRFDLAGQNHTQQLQFNMANPNKN